MKRGGRRERQAKRYTCPNPPCLHVVVDERKGMFKVFFDDGEILQPIPASVLESACRELAEARSSAPRLREAEAEEIDYLARKYLHAEPVDEYEEIVEEE